jgi:uncharacterized protein YjbI with pentapeptide repeats
MAEKTRKAERARETPRNLPTVDQSHPGTKAQLLEGGHLEDTIFSEIDLSTQRLAELKGSSLIFDRVSFANCEIGSLNLVDTRLIGCDLSNAMLRRFAATRVEFLDCKLIGMNAFGCRWDDVLLDHCDARFAQLGEGRLRRCELRGSQLREAGLVRVTLEATKLIDVVLRQADLAETRLAGIDLSACDIEGITLRVEDLRGAIVSAPQAMELARLLEVVIK